MDNKKLIIEYLPFANKISKMKVFNFPRSDQPDLLAYGMIGLVKAINTYDKSKGTQIKTWIEWNIKWYIDYGSIKINNLSKRGYDLKKEGKIDFEICRLDEEGILENIYNFDPKSNHHDTCEQNDLINVYKQSVDLFFSDYKKECDKPFKIKFYDMMKYCYLKYYSANDSFKVIGNEIGLSQSRVGFYVAEARKGIIKILQDKFKIEIKTMPSGDINSWHNKKEI